MKILIAAYACDPYAGSEEGVGWGWSLIAARKHQVWVITDEDHRCNIENYLADNPLPNLHFEYISKTRFFRFTEKYFQLMPLLAWRGYLCWQQDAFAHGMELHKEIGFDIVHNLTYVGFRAPGRWYQSDIPFVWGPVGGLEQTNLKLAWALGLRCFVWYFARNILNWRDKVFCRRAKLGMNAAEGGLIAATSAIQKEIKKYFNRQSVVVSEIGINGSMNSAVFQPVCREGGSALRLIWVGRLIPGKGLPFFLDAVLKLPGINCTIDIFGDGYYREKLKKMAKAKGLANKITWHGNQPLETVKARLKLSHAMVISSIYDLSSTVAVEALSCGIPVIAPDICGFPESVPDGCGLRFAADTPAKFINGIAGGIDFLYRNEDKRIEMAKNAVSASKKFEWDSKSEILERIYHAKHAIRCNAAIDEWNSVAYNNINNINNINNQ